MALLRRSRLQNEVLLLSLINLDALQQKVYEVGVLRVVGLDVCLDS